MMSNTPLLNRWKRQGCAANFGRKTTGAGWWLHLLILGLQCRICLVLRCNNGGGDDLACRGDRGEGAVWLGRGEGRFALNRAAEVTSVICTGIEVLIGMFGSNAGLDEG